MLVGRDHERKRLLEAVSERRSLLVSGPGGSGKSALLDAVLSSLSPRTRARCIVCSGEGAPNAIWKNLVGAFAAADDKEVMTRVENETGSRRNPDRWIQAQTSLRLRGILRQATHSREYSIFLDAKTALPDGVYGLLQEWVWSRRTPVVLLARGTTQTELGRVANLYWNDDLRLILGALDPVSAEALLEDTISRFQLAKLADGRFRDFVLKRSGGVPGSIVRLCEMASDVAYHYDGQLKLNTLAVDFVLQQRCPTERVVRHA